MASEREVRDGLERFPVTWSVAATAAHAAAIALYIPLTVTARLASIVGNAVSAELPATELCTVQPRGFKRENIRASEIAETDTLSIGERSTADLTVVVVPGNPGHPLFYTAFMERLHKQAVAAATGREVCVMAISHLGHSPAAPARPCSYLEQSRHAADVVATLQRSNPRSVFVLVGHSIGCRLLLDMFAGNGAAAGWDESRVSRAVLLFPTVSFIGYSPNGFSNYPVMRCYSAMSAILEAARPAMKIGWLEPAASLRLGDAAPSTSVRALSEIFASESAANLLYMGLTEMTDVLGAPKLDRRAQEKLLFYIGGQCEKWVTRPDVEQLEREFLASDIRHCQEEIPHAFVLSHNETVADKTWEWVLNTIGS